MQLPLNSWLVALHHEEAVQYVLKNGREAVRDLYPDDESCPCVFGCSRPRLHEEDVPYYEELLRLLLLLLQQ